MKKLYGVENEPYEIQVPATRRPTEGELVANVFPPDPRISTSTEKHVISTFRITPELRAKILRKGQPLLSVLPPGIAAATQGTNHANEQR